jgi:hypothetical protein
MVRDGGDGGSDLLLTCAFCSDLKLQPREGMAAVVQQLGSLVRI